MCSLAAGYIAKRLMRREGAVCLGLFGSVSSRDLLPGTDERPMSNSPDMTASCCSPTVKLSFHHQCAILSRSIFRVSIRFSSVSKIAATTKIQPWDTNTLRYRVRSVGRP